MKKVRVAVFNDTRERGHYGCQGVMDVIFSEMASRGLEPVFLWPVGRDWRDHMNELPPPETIDAIIVNGEGSIHHSNARAICLSEIADLARSHYRVPAFLINSTLYRNGPSVYERISNFDAVYVRDNGSFQELQKHGLKGAVVPDLTMSIPVSVREVGRRGFSITDSVNIQTSRKLRSISKDISAVYFNFATPALSLGKRNLSHPRRLLREMEEYVYGRLSARSRPEGVSNFLLHLQEQKLLITGRYHAVTMALLTRTPFVACESNTPKISWLLSDVFGHDSRMIAPEALGSAKISDYAEFSCTEKRQLEAFLSGAATATAEMFDAIAAAARGFARNGETQD